MVRLKRYTLLLGLIFLALFAATACSSNSKSATAEPTALANTASPVATSTPISAATDTAVPPTPSPSPTSTPEPIPFALSSTAFNQNETIPERHSCNGNNLSPELTWTAPPAGTQSLALVMDDPDAVGVVGFVYDHWLLFNLPAAARTLPEGIGRGADLPEGSLTGTNSARSQQYAGPCPPNGQTHNYVFTLYALDISLDIEAGANKTTLQEAMDGHILGTAQLIGVYTSP
ncbi:MAG: YbhB/YbcL family Raf kinase inhibitor-like protein [Chloroflexota bacterium]